MVACESTPPCLLPFRRPPGGSRVVVVLSLLYFGNCYRDFSCSVFISHANFVAGFTQGGEWHNGGVR